MSYENYIKGTCDKCRKVPKDNELVKVPFIYLDKNDVAHEDVSERCGYPKGSGYRQYYACKNCIKKGV